MKAISEAVVSPQLPPPSSLDSGGVSPVAEEKDPFLTVSNTDSGRKIRDAHRYFKAVKEKVSAGDSARDGIIEFAELGIFLADRAYAEGDKEFAEALLKASLSALDTALDFVPGVSLAKDLTTISTGVNPVTQQKVTDAERAFLVAGILAPTAIQGSAKVLKRFGSLGTKLIKESAAGKALAERFLGVIRKAEESLVEYAGKIPCLSDARPSLYELFLQRTIFPERAYADCLIAPGEIIERVAARLSQSHPKHLERLANESSITEKYKILIEGSDIDGGAKHLKEMLQKQKNIKEKLKSLPEGKTINAGESGDYLGQLGEAEAVIRCAENGEKISDIGKKVGRTTEVDFRSIGANGEKFVTEVKSGLAGTKMDIGQMTNQMEVAQREGATYRIITDSWSRQTQEELDNVAKGFPGVKVVITIIGK